RRASAGAERVGVGRFHFLDAMGEHSLALGGPSREAVRWVGIEHNDATAHGGKFGCQVAGDGGFADAAFSSRPRDDRHRSWNNDYRLFGRKWKGQRRFGDGTRNGDCGYLREAA